MARGVALVVEYRGEKKTIAELAALAGIDAATLRVRIRDFGMSAEEAVSRPLRKRSRSGGRPARNVPRPAPKLKKHPSGRAYSRWKMAGGVNERYFGRYGSPEAADAYRRFAADWTAGKYDVAPESAGGGGRLTVAALAGRWLDHCRGYYTKDGKPTSEVRICVGAVRILNGTHGESFAEEFDPAALRAYRDAVIASGATRGTVNTYQSRIVRMFAWGAGQSAVPAAVHGALRLVEQLKPGRTDAPDRARKKPTTDEQIAATCAQLLADCPDTGPKMVAMIGLQRLTGMRPGEVCALSAADIDTTGDVWRYTVGAANKNRHRGKAQVYFLGPRAVSLLRPFLEAAPSGPVFVRSGDTYRLAVTRSAERAGCGRWTPHQLRHALATQVATVFRSSASAAAAIGDTEAVASAVYVHVDPKEQAKIEIARKLG
jgi:integrase